MRAEAFVDALVQTAPANSGIELGNMRTDLLNIYKAVQVRMKAAAWS
jgi:hypothetical protein